MCPGQSSCIWASIYLNQLHGFNLLNAVCVIVARSGLDQSLSEKPLRLERPLGVGFPWGIKDFKSASLFPRFTRTHHALISWKPFIKKDKKAPSLTYIFLWQRLLKNNKTKAPCGWKPKRRLVLISKQTNTPWKKKKTNLNVFHISTMFFFFLTQRPCSPSKNYKTAVR